MSQIQLNNVSVVYNLQEPRKRKAGTALQRLSAIISPSYEKKPFNALSDVSFELQSGDRLALLGESGAGKSTLLKLLAKFIVPSSGNYFSVGHITPYLEAKGSLINYATCLENIRLRGYLYGYKGESLETYMAHVSEKSGLAQFLNSPVQKLSTGMRAKLLVSMLEIHAGEILLMDEWIGTTDKNSLAPESTLYQAIMSAQIFVLASHNEKILNAFCNKGLVLEKGQVKFFGSLPEAVEHYKSNK